jgi:uncharacterized protein (TIGR02246 family)
MRYALLVGLLVAASVPVASLLSQTPAQTTPSVDAAMPSVTLPPALDRVLRDYERAWRSGDAAAVAALFAEDGFLLQSGRAPIRGRTAITKAYTGQAGGALRLRAYAYATADTVGYILGAYGYGEGNADMGKFTVTLRRDRGGPWLLFSDMDNGSQPRRTSP